MYLVVFFRSDWETVVTCNFNETDFVLEKEMSRKQSFLREENLFLNYTNTKAVQ